MEKEKVLEKSKEHFKETLNLQHLNKQSFDEHLYNGEEIESLDGEVPDAIQRLKNNKPPGMDGLPTEWFKYGG